MTQGSNSFIKKYVVGTPADNGGKGAAFSAGNNTYLMRYAEVLLIEAEAVLGNGSSTSDAAALGPLNKIRRRAGLIPLTSVTKDNILRERRIELAFEGSRFWDLRRWKTAASELNAPITGWTISQSSAVGYYQTRVIYNQTFIAPRDYLWPIQTGAFRVNTNLVQNPGW